MVERMAVLGDLLTGKLRAEMKSRVEEVLKCGNEWNQTARELTEALDKLTEAVQKGNFDLSIPRSVARSARRLAKQTAKLTAAFEAHNKTLTEIIRRYG